MSSVMSTSMTSKPTGVEERRRVLYFRRPGCERPGRWAPSVAPTTTGICGRRCWRRRRSLSGRTERRLFRCGKRRGWWGSTRRPATAISTIVRRSWWRLRSWVLPGSRRILPTIARHRRGAARGRSCSLFGGATSPLRCGIGPNFALCSARAAARRATLGCGFPRSRSPLTSSSIRRPASTSTRAGCRWKTTRSPTSCGPWVMG